MNFGIDRLFGLHDLGTGQYIQYRSLQDDSTIPSVLEKVLLDQKKKYDEGTLRGYLGEYCSRSLVRSCLEEYMTEQKGFKIVGMNERGYAIGSNGKRILKASNDKNIVLVEKQKDEIDDNYGFRIVSETDGLFCVVSRQPGLKRQKEYVVVESKTGGVGLSPDHVFENVILPYARILNSPLHYVLIDFRGRLFNPNGRKIMKESLRDNFYLPLQDRIRNGGLKSPTSVGVIEFPFSQDIFLKEVRRGMQIQEGYDLFSGRMEKETGRVKVTIGNDKQDGLLILKDDPRFKDVMELLGSS